MVARTFLSTRPSGLREYAQWVLDLKAVGQIFVEDNPRFAKRVFFRMCGYNPSREDFE